MESPVVLVCVCVFALHYGTFIDTVYSPEAEDGRAKGISEAAMQQRALI